MKCGRQEGIKGHSRDHGSGGSPGCLSLSLRGDPAFGCRACLPASPTLKPERSGLLVWGRNDWEWRNCSVFINAQLGFRKQRVSDGDAGARLCPDGSARAGKEGP